MPTLASKLHIKADMRLALLNAPKEHRDIFRDAPPGCSVSTAGTGKVDLVLLFAPAVKDLERLFPIALRRTKEDAPLWIGFPKQTGALKSDLTRDRGWDVVRKAGFRPVTLIAVDETWSAMRVRRKELVKTNR